MTVLTDGSQAGTGCINAGQHEMMVHRHLLEDDGRGVGEPLNEMEYVNPYVNGYERGLHYGPGLIIRGKYLLSLEVFSCAAKVWCSRQEAMQRVLSPAGCCAVIRVSSHAFTSKVVEHLLSGMCSTATRRRAGSGTSGCRTSKLLLSLVV